MATLFPVGGRATRLTGRRSERDVVDRLVEAVRAGESRALLVRGEPGVGKTALLEYLVEDASGCRVVRAVGVQSEMELAFAGLHQLCAPMLDRLERLPVPQGEALRSAFGVSPGWAPDRCLVALAVLGLLSNIADQRPRICVVDDEQWLDRASAQVLAFVTRRLEAESVGLVQYHLHKVFTKLDISSRNQLDRVLPSDPAAVRYARPFGESAFRFARRQVMTGQLCCALADASAARANETRRDAIAKRARLPADAPSMVTFTTPQSPQG